MFQFTLYSLLKGNKLDFHRSMAPAESQQLYQNFITELKKAYVPERIKVVYLQVCFLQHSCT